MSDDASSVVELQGLGLSLGQGATLKAEALELSRQRLRRGLRGLRSRR